MTSHIISLYINLIISQVYKKKSHVNIIMLHTDIIYLALYSVGGRSMPVYHHTKYIQKPTILMMKTFNMSKHTNSP